MTPREQIIEGEPTLVLGCTIYSTTTWFYGVGLESKCCRIPPGQSVGENEERGALECELSLVD